MRQYIFAKSLFLFPLCIDPKYCISFPFTWKLSLKKTPVGSNITNHRCSLIIVINNDGTAFLLWSSDRSFLNLSTNVRYRCRMLYRGVWKTAARKGAPTAAAGCPPTTGRWLRLEMWHSCGGLAHNEADRGLSSPVRHKKKTKWKHDSAIWTRWSPSVGVS